MHPLAQPPADNEQDCAAHRGEGEPDLDRNDRILERELDQDKLGSLLELKYRSVPDAADQLGGVPLILDTFVGFQQYLYEQRG